MRDGARDDHDVRISAIIAPEYPSRRAQEIVLREGAVLADRFTVRRAALGDVEWRWGGGAASARMTGYFRGDQTVLYVKEPRDGLAQQLQLRQGLGL